jgi:LuxR family transcriptional regulator, maltose regulon positive regulatory protein
VIIMAEATEVRTAVPMLATKLRRPSTPLLLIDRPRLLDQLTTYVDRRLILVSAPAGYGKTALISHWLDAAAGAYAWLSLDEQDNELATFLLYLVAAIQGAYPDAMAAVEQQLRAPTLLSPVRLADAVLQGMAAFPRPLVLALDDYHVIKASDVHALMARLIEHLPPHVHLVVITRADPPLPLDRLRGRQQLGETRAADLRFNPEEARLLLQQMLGPEVSEETVALLEDSTEGWAVGLHLAGLSLRNRSDPAAFARKIAEHGHQAVTEYLLSEVLACQPEVQRDCLLQTSLFDRFCAPLIDAVQAEDGEKLSGDDFLRAIRRGNLFVVSLDDEGTWYRYHHFFQALLRARLGLRYANAEIRAMHARAAVWFSAQGLVDEAVMHFLEAGDPVAAASLVEAQVHPALDREDWRQIERWIGLLPFEMRQRPRLLTAQAWLHVLRYQFTAAAPLLDAAEAGIVADPATVRGSESVVRGEINVLAAMIAYYKGDYKRTVEMTEAALGQLGSETLYATGQASLYHIWGLQGSGEHARAIEFAHRQLEAYGLRANALTLRVLLVLVNTYYEMADLPRMEESAAVFQELARQSGLGASLAWVHYMHGWLHYQRNELAEAERSYRTLTGMSAVAHAKALVDGHVGLALTALARGCPSEATGAIAALRQRLIERDMLAFTAVAESLEQRVALAVEPGSSLDWGPGTRSAAVPGDFWEQPLLTRVRTLLAAGSPDDLSQAADLLADSRAKALSRSFTRRLIEVGGLQALVLAAQGQEAAALAALQEAVERAAPGGALRLLADCGPGLIGLLQKLLAAGVAPRYVQKVLAAIGEPTALGEPASAPTVPALQRGDASPAPSQEVSAETLTNREIDVLILLAERLSDKEIGERLVLSPLTIKKYTQRIYSKLDVHSRRAAVARASRLGLI